MWDLQDMELPNYNKLFLGVVLLSFLSHSFIQINNSTQD